MPSLSPSSQSSSSSSPYSLSRMTWWCLTIAVLPLAVLVQATAASSTTTTTTITQTSQNTFRIHGAAARQMKAAETNRDKNNNNNDVRMPPPLVRREDVPIDEEKWQSLNQDVEFIPSEGIDPHILQRFLSGTGSWTDIYQSENFAYGGDEYDEYQQAWRLLGFIIDCNPMVDDDYYAQGSGDEVTEDGCARYVLWAAYVDLEYEGGGIGEYQYWDRFNQVWDASPCEYSGSERCAKMDCHLETTHFSLLGFFKHKSYDDWMEQLFKHEGVCVWTDEEYAFMASAREAWPQGCVASGSTTSDGTAIYYDVKPIQGGDITVGLYTDTQCIKEYDYKDSSVTVDSLLGNFLLNNGGSGDNNNNYDFSSDSLEDSLARWDSAFGAFHYCQPCVAYDLENIDGSKFYDDDGGNGGGDMFDCYDDADYTNVNQCMKFMAKTTMNTATFRDMSLGRYQGTLVATPLSGFQGNKSWRRESWSNKLTYLFLAVASCFFAYGLIYFLRVRRATNFTPTFGFNVKEPLVFT